MTDVLDERAAAPEGMFSPDDPVGTLWVKSYQGEILFARIGELDPTEQATSDLLVAHELALRDFGRKEIAGDGADSTVAVTALAHMQ